MKIIETKEFKKIKNKFSLLIMEISKIINLKDYFFLLDYDNNKIKIYYKNKTDIFWKKDNHIYFYTYTNKDFRDNIDKISKIVKDGMKDLL